MKIIGIFGVSGVGKTTLIEHMRSAEPDWVHVSGGTLIQESRQTQLRDDLRVVSHDIILTNQTVMLESLSALKHSLKTPLLIFDGHLTIDAADGVFDVPMEVVSMLGLSAMVFVHDDPESILRNRSSDKTRQRSKRSGKEIGQEQAHARAIALGYAALLNLPIVTITPRDESKLLAYARELLE